jgi:uncharacterized protein YndB with AHSA1/START domain
MMKTARYFMALAAVAACFGGVAVRAAEPLVTDGIVNAPASEIWRAITTPEGYEIMGAAHAQVDLTIGGEIRTHYDPQGRLGDPETIVNEILAYDPGRMLAIRVKQAPASFPFRDVIDGTWSVFYLTPLGEDMTHLEVVGLGYTDDPASQRMREYFDKGNRYTLDRIIEHYAPKCARCEADAGQPGTQN